MIFFFSIAGSSVFFISSISTQYDVVSAVSAESALEKAAATIPTINTARTVGPKCSLANTGKILSETSGVWYHYAVHRKSTKLPNLEIKKLMGANANPYDNTFFCASLRLLMVRFFCIWSWSRPVITIVINTPLKNCLKKFCVLVQSSNTKIRECELLLIAFTNQQY